MNDKLNYSGTTPDSGEITVESGSVTESTEPTDNSTDVDTGVSDTLGSDDLLPTAPEDIKEVLTGSETENTVDIPQTVSDTSTDLSGIYSELEYIDYLLIEQTDLLQNTLTVSGNSVSVSIDNTGMQALTSVADNQLVLIENQNVLIGLIGCVLMAVCIDFLFASAKRSIKWLTGRKE